jgi:adenine-specific DNA glycosylase
VRLSGELLIVERRGRVLLRQREATASRMAGFWDLPAPEDLPHAKPGPSLGQIRHTITHHHYTLGVRYATLNTRAADPFRWFAPAELREIPLSTTARKALALAGPVYKL